MGITKTKDRTPAGNSYKKLTAQYLNETLYFASSLSRPKTKLHELIQSVFWIYK